MEGRRMKWITREHVKVDRVACPWLIRKFVDPQAEFHFVPGEQGMFVRGDSEEIRSGGGSGAGVAWQDREWRGHRQHVVAAAGGRGAERHRGRVSPPEF